MLCTNSCGIAQSRNHRAPFRICVKCMAIGCTHICFQTQQGSNNHPPLWMVQLKGRSRVMCALLDCRLFGCKVGPNIFSTGARAHQSASATATPAPVPSAGGQADGISGTIRHVLSSEFGASVFLGGPYKKGPCQKRGKHKSRFGTHAFVFGAREN